MTLLLTGALVAAVLAFGAGSAMAAPIPVDCTTNHFAFGPAPATISPGSYTIKGVCYGPFFVNSGLVTLTGIAPGAALDGQADGTLATLQTSGDVTINNLTIKNGYSGAFVNGGGISAYGSVTVTLNNSTVTGNTSGGWGGGVALDNSALFLNPGSKVTGNTAAYGGGGIEATDCSFVEVTNASITSNTANAAPGGGLSMDYYGCGSAGGFFSGATVSGNTAADPGAGNFGGGGIYLQTVPGNSGAALTVDSSTISGNKATGRASGFGGGIWSDGGDVYLDNSTVTGNIADFGGGIAHWADCGASCLVGTGMSLDGSNVHHNTATVTGGGIYNASYDGDANVELDASTVAFNIAKAGDGGGVANIAQNGNTAALLATGSSIGGNLALNLNGGGIFNYSGNGTALVTLATTRVGQLNNTLNPNKARHGGGIFNDAIGGVADVSINNKTQVVHNMASFPGGGLDNVCGGTFTVVPGAVVLFNAPTNILNDLTPCP